MSALQLHPVLWRQPARGLEPRHDTDRRPARVIGDTTHTIFEQFRIATEFVDYEAANQRAIGFVQHNVRSYERSYDMPTIDVADQHDGQPERMGQSYVGDVVPAQIRFGRAARTLYDHQLSILREPPIALRCHIEQSALVTSVRACVERTNHLATNDELCTDF